jgi:nitroreductase
VERFETYDRLLSICESRSSTRTFDAKRIPDEVIEKILTIARTSPYASAKKNWDVAVITDRDKLGRMKQAVEDRVSSIRKIIRPDVEEQFAAYAGNFTFFASAPAVFVPVFRTAPALSLMVPGPDPSVVQWERDNFVKSISCVAMLILLAAESVGLGGCYVTGALIAEQELAALLDLPPGRNIGALIPVGYRTGGQQ